MKKMEYIIGMALIIAITIVGLFVGFVDLDASVRFDITKNCLIALFALIIVSVGFTDIVGTKETQEDEV